MKSDSKRARRAADEIAERLRTFLSELGLTMQQRHGLTPYMLGLATTKAVGVVLAEYAESAGVLNAEQASNVVERIDSCTREQSLA